MNKIYFVKLLMGLGFLVPQVGCAPAGNKAGHNTGVGAKDLIQRTDLSPNQRNGQNSGPNGNQNQPAPGLITPLPATTTSPTDGPKVQTNPSVQPDKAVPGQSNEDQISQIIEMVRALSNANNPNISTNSENVKTECADKGSWNYCVHQYAGGNPDVLYYIHGFTDSSKGWVNAPSGEYANNLSQLQKLLGKNSPTVVVISYSNKLLDSWLLSKSEIRTGGPKSATLGHFVNVAMSEIEKGIAFKGRRILYGMSMGGFNAAQLCLNQPSLWDRCLFQQPLMVTCDAYAQPTDYFCLGGFLIRQNFNQMEWIENDILRNAKTMDLSGVPRVFVSGARKDGFKFFESNQLFAEILQSKGLSVEWHEYPGEHMSFDPELVHEFITRK